MYIDKGILFYAIIGVIILIYSLGCVIAEKRADKATRKWYEKYREMLKKAADERVQSSPWLAEQLADIMASYDEAIAVNLRWKKYPARKAADQVSAIAKEKHELQKLNKVLKYQLSYYETLFPWLEEFKEVDAKEGWKVTYEISGSEVSEYESIRDWLSPEEYKNLSQTEKYQLVLDRYKTRKKNDWEIGIEYERYIGYIYELKGYKVKYFGALQGLEDMGRDLIAENNNETLVIQCKRWSKNKTIHEKHIFQLFGSTVLLQIKNPEKQYIGVFITTTILSETAKKCAQRLGIRVIEGWQYEDYPMIKCNTSSSGEKIYHLPMDQQYDRVVIANKNGGMFAKTIHEANSNGYRRAYKWRGQVN